MDFENADSYQELLASLTPAIISNMKHAIELGKWPDGRELTPEQREQSLRAVLVWEAHNLPEDQRTGYLGQSCKSAGKASSSQDKQEIKKQDSILRFQDA